MNCRAVIFNYHQDDLCLRNEIKSWLHGKLHPAGNYNFRQNPPQLHGQIGVPLVVDDILGMTENLVQMNNLINMN